MIKKQRRDCGAVASSTTARQPLSLLQTSIVPYKSESRMGRDSRKYMNDRIESIWLSCFLTTISLLPHTLAIDDPCSAVPFLASTNSNYDVSFFHNLHRPLFSRELSRQTGDLKAHVVHELRRYAVRKPRTPELESRMNASDKPIHATPVTSSGSCAIKTRPKLLITRYS